MRKILPSYQSVTRTDKPFCILLSHPNPSPYNWLGRKVDGKSEILELSPLKRENEALYQLVGRLTYQQNLHTPGEKS